MFELVHLPRRERLRPLGAQLSEDLPRGFLDRVRARRHLHQLRAAVRRIGHAFDVAQRRAADLWVQPGGAVVGEHVHDHLRERFTVLEGELSVVLEGRRSVAYAGDVVEVAPGRAHDWSNAGAAVAHVLVEVEAVEGAGPMAARFFSAIEAGFGLANTGHTNEQGRPTPLWLFAFAHEYADVLYLTTPPRAVQRALFGPLAALARRLGRDPRAGWLHGPGCPAQAQGAAGTTTSGRSSGSALSSKLGVSSRATWS